MDNQSTVCEDFVVGDWVIATENTSYKNLIGVVIAIDRLGTTEHNEENDTDDIHIDFFVYDYPEEYAQEIEQRFCELYNEDVEFYDLSLDDVIMAPDMLICITNLMRENISYLSILQNYYGVLTKT